MGTAVPAAGLLRTTLRYAPPFAIALVTAELFFKFHSFTLECLAFLALWKALDWIAGRLAGESGGSFRLPGF
jgi:hypothetical protein